MKVPKSLIGCMVMVRWMDPFTGVTEVSVEGPPRRGRSALATQFELGRIDDITDGVVRILHYEATHPGDEKPDEFRHTWVLEDLIEDVQVYEPRKLTDTPKEGVSQ